MALAQQRQARTLIGLLVALSALLLGACNERARPPGVPALPTLSVSIGSQSFILEVADTPAARQRGLMHRPSMAPDRGMLFIFDPPRDLTFWMRNTAIPLDIIFLDERGRVLNIEQMRPFDEITQTRSFGAAMYAIELNQGAAAGAGVKVGDRIALPARP